MSSTKQLMALLYDCSFVGNISIFFSKKNYRGFPKEKKFKSERILENLPYCVLFEEKLLKTEITD